MGVETDADVTYAGDCLTTVVVAAPVSNVVVAELLLLLLALVLVALKDSIGSEPPLTLEVRGDDNGADKSTGLVLAPAVSTVALLIVKEMGMMGMEGSTGTVAETTGAAEAVDGSDGGIADDVADKAEVEEVENDDGGVVAATAGNESAASDG